MKKTVAVAILTLFSLSACAMTPEQFYGTSDPQIIAMKRAQLDADLAASNAQLAQTTASIRAQGNSVQQNIPAYLENPEKPGTYFVYCRELGTYVVSCNVR